MLAFPDDSAPRRNIASKVMSLTICITPMNHREGEIRIEFCPDHKSERRLRRLLTVVYGISSFLSQNLLYVRGTATRLRHSGCIDVHLNRRTAPVLNVALEVRWNINHKGVPTSIPLRRPLALRRLHPVAPRILLVAVLVSRNGELAHPAEFVTCRQLADVLMWSTCPRRWTSVFRSISNWLAKCRGQSLASPE